MNFKFLLKRMLTVCCCALLALACSDDDAAPVPTPDPDPDPDPKPEVEMTFELEVSDITERTAGLKCTPSVQDRTYVFDFTEAAAFEGLDEQARIRKIMQADPELKTGTQSLTCKDLAPETDYLAYALDAEKQDKLTLLPFTTGAAPVEGPLQLELKGRAGDGNGANKDVAVTFEMRCVTGDAMSLEYFVSEKQRIDDILSAGHTLDDIVEGNEGINLGGDELRMANGEGFSTTLTSADGVLCDTGYTLLVVAYDDKSNRALERCDTKTEPAHGGGEITNPEVTVTGKAGTPVGANPSSAITYTVVCTTKDASYGEAFIVDTKIVEELLQTLTVEELLDQNEGMGRGFSLDDLNLMNGEGISIYWEELLGGTGYTLLVNVKNKVGGRVVARCDAVTDPDQEPDPGDGEKPDVKVAAMAGDAYGMDSDTKAMVAIRCFSQDAVYASCMFVEQPVIDGLWGEGLTDEAIMDDPNNYYEYSQSILDRINGKGYRDFRENLTPSTLYGCLVDVRTDKGRVVNYVRVTTDAAK